MNEEKKLCASTVTSIDEPRQMCIKQNCTHFEQLLNTVLSNFFTRVSFVFR